MRFNIFAAFALFCGLFLTACGSGKPEEAIVGEWKLDAAAMKEVMMNDEKFKKMPEEARKAALEGSMKMLGSMSMTITKDNKISMGMGKDMKQEGTYKIAGTDGNVVTLETTMKGKTDKINITVDGGKLKVKGPKGPEMVMVKK